MKNYTIMNYFIFFALIMSVSAQAMNMPVPGANNSNHASSVITDKKNIIKENLIKNDSHSLSTEEDEQIKNKFQFYVPSENRIEISNAMVVISECIYIGLLGCAIYIFIS